MEYTMTLKEYYDRDDKKIRGYITNVSIAGRRILGVRPNFDDEKFFFVYFVAGSPAPISIDARQLCKVTTDAKEETE